MVSDRPFDPMTFGTGDSKVKKLIIILEWIQLDNGTYVIDEPFAKFADRDERAFPALRAFIKRGKESVSTARFEASGLKDSPNIKTVRMTSGNVLKFAIQPVQPDYPKDLQDQGVGGTVTVDIVIDENGRVVEVALQSNPKPSILDGFVQAAMSAATKWRFKPQTLQGEPIRVRSSITFNLKRK